MNAMGFILAAGLLPLVFTGCINQRSPRDISISSVPSGATVVIRNSDWAPVFDGTTPCTARLYAGSNGQMYYCKVSADGYEPSLVRLNSGLSGQYGPSVILFGLTGVLLNEMPGGPKWDFDKYGINVVLVPIDPKTASARQKPIPFPPGITPLEYSPHFP